MTETNAWIRLLLKHGYRWDQLVFDRRGGRPTCAVDDLAAAAALVQNPHGIELNTAEQLNEIRDRLKLGYLPHHLVIFSDGSLYLDREAVTYDCERIAFGKFDKK